MRISDWSSDVCSSDLNVAILRTGRFFPEDDDTHAVPSGPNLKANELLNRRLTVEDAAAAHLAALEAAPAIGCDSFILSAPPPFVREDAEELARDARAVIARYHPDARSEEHTSELQSLLRISYAVFCLKK